MERTNRTKATILALLLILSFLTSAIVIAQTAMANGGWKTEPVDTDCDKYKTPDVDKRTRDIDSDGKIDEIHLDLNRNGKIDEGEPHLKEGGWDNGEYIREILNVIESNDCETGLTVRIDYVAKGYMTHEAAHVVEKTYRVRDENDDDDTEDPGECKLIIPVRAVRVYDPEIDLLYINTGKPAAEYFGYLDITEVFVQQTSDELLCSITVAESIPTSPDYFTLYHFMFEANNDLTDNDPEEGVDTAYRVIYKQPIDTWTMLKAKYDVSEGWMPEDTNAVFGTGNETIAIWIPLNEIDGETGTRPWPWKVKTETFNGFPDLGDFVPDEGLTYLWPRYEMFGPRADRITIKFYENETEMLSGLEMGEVDIMYSDGILIDQIIEPYTLTMNYDGWTAYSRHYTGGTGGNLVTPDDGENKYRGKPWEDMVNMYGCGVGNYWSFLKMHPQDYECGDGENMTVRYGCVGNMTSLNPIYAVLKLPPELDGCLFDSLLKPDIYTRKPIPWLAENYTESTWFNPYTGEECPKVTFTLRPDATWHDGTPLTTADVYFTFVELPKTLEERGYPPPVWIDKVANITDFKILDPYNFEVLCSDGETGTIVWRTMILPMYIWKPIVEEGDPTTFAPDLNMIGSGPWRFASYDGVGNRLLFVANGPGSTVTTNLPGSTSITSPNGYFRRAPLTIVTSLPGKFDEGSYMFNTTICNLCLTEDITANITMTIDDWNVGTFTDQSIPAGTIYRLWTSYYFPHGLHTMKVKADWSIPSESGTKAYTQTMWTSIKADIIGSNFYDDIGLHDYPYKGHLPTPDFKVDIKDIAIAAKAFGSYPGHPRWESVADIIADYSINIKDIASFAKKFGWSA